MPCYYNRLFYIHATQRFPEDEKAVEVSYQFMWGPSVLVSPRVDEDPEVEAYFPAGLWYNFHDGSAVDAPIGKMTILSASGDQTHVHIRGGYIVPTYAREGPADNSLRLFVAPNNESKANGALYWDDGITYHEDFGAAPHIKGIFGFEKDDTDFTMSVSMEEINGPHNSWRPTIQEVTICGVRKVTNVVLHDRASTKNVQFTHNPKTRVLEISSINVSTRSYKIKILTL